MWERGPTHPPHLNALQRQLSIGYGILSWPGPCLGVQRLRVRWVGEHRISVRASTCARTQSN